MRKIIIRTLGGEGIGYGHYYRCLSLAKAINLLERDTEITFIINQDLVTLVENAKFYFMVCGTLEEDCNLVKRLKPDLVVLDSYLADDNYLRRIKEESKLMLIDDNNDIYDTTIPDIIYNGNIHADELGYPNVDGQLRLLGPKYLIMKEEYWVKEEGICQDKEGILVTTGGTDEYSVILSILNVLTPLDIKIKVILGPGFKKKYIEEIENKKRSNIELIYQPKSLKPYICAAKVIVTAGGSSVYEILSQRSIPILFSIADNQNLICKRLSNMGVVYIGRYPKIDYNKLVREIKIAERDNVNLKHKVFNLVNSNGANLVADMMLATI